MQLAQYLLGGGSSKLKMIGTCFSFYGVNPIREESVMSIRARFPSRDFRAA